MQTTSNQVQSQPHAKRSNLRAAIVPVSIALAFLLGYVAKQVLFK